MLPGVGKRKQEDMMVTYLNLASNAIISYPQYLQSNAWLEKIIDDPKSLDEIQQKRFLHIIRELNYPIYNIVENYRYDL